jgi:uncharacterized membrane protein (DUF106 family)
MLTYLKEIKEQQANMQSDNIEMSAMSSEAVAVE